MTELGASKNLQLREIVASDLEEIARFINRFSESETPISRAVERLSWILLQNPARKPGDPLGWLLRTSSKEIGGCLCCAPQKFCFAQKTFTLMMANSFYVDDRHRGAGASLFLKFLQLGRCCPLFVSSANPTVAEMWQKLGAYPLANSNHELLGIIRWPPLLRESLFRKTDNNRIAQFTSALASPFLRPRHDLLRDSAEAELRPLATPAAASALCAGHRSGKITCFRDVAFLQWRYFSVCDRTTHLFAFRSRNVENQVFVAARLQNRGYKRQIRVLHVLDIWGEPDPETLLSIAACLWREYADRIDLLIFRCLDAIHQQALTTHGFKIRRLAAPIAWCLDKHRLLPANNWYLVPADGDMFL
jgi:hypothetical protein